MTAIAPLAHVKRQIDRLDRRSHPSNASLPQPPHRQRRRGVAAHIRVPIGPGAFVDDARRGVVEGGAEVFVGYVLADDLHVLMRRVAHGGGREAHRVGQGVLGRFKPDHAAHDGVGLGGQRDRRDQLGFAAPARAATWRAAAITGASIILPSCMKAPASVAAAAVRMARAWARAASVGAKAAWTGATCLGWMQSLPA